MRLWTEKNSMIGPGIYMYSGNRRGMELYVENRFTNLVFGLESLHRAITTATMKPKLDSKIDRIIEQVSLKKDKEWLKEQLKFCREPSLSSRLVELFEVIPAGIERVRLEQFAKRCAGFRNDISHFGGIRNPQEQNNFVHEVAKVNGALDVLYHARILKEIGVKDDIIHKTMTDDHVAFMIKWELFEGGLLAEDPSRPKPPPRPIQSQP